MEKFNENKTGDIHIRNSIKKIDHSIKELEKTKAVLVSMLPKKILEPSNRNCNTKLTPLDNPILTPPVVKIILLSLFI
ncbi:hypothetical protein [uncultured Desulfobacter sp.]|uniref:hypothetical protein n=1 Tax=uncultured Desulfobacter sp. TaxID=240139 RepID=UPI002AA605B6|nr:hypothetical protein [uncultured Desulfobacter sp.]